MRIVAGVAGSIPLAVPAAGTRPTSDRVREALFSALAARGAVADARVLDLFAGSGALGLEALSRGAASAVLVESERAAVRVLERNATAVERALDAAERSRTGRRRARVVASSADAHLRRAPASSVDLAFLDPPYALDEDSLAATLELLAPALAPEALVVVEREARSPEPSWPASVVLERRRDYGGTALWLARADPA